MNLLRRQELQIQLANGVSQGFEIPWLSHTYGVRVLGDIKAGTGIRRVDRLTKATQIGESEVVQVPDRSVNMGWLSFLTLRHNNVVHRVAANDIDLTKPRGP